MFCWLYSRLFRVAVGGPAGDVLPRPGEGAGSSGPEPDAVCCGARGCDSQMGAYGGDVDGLDGAVVGEVGGSLFLQGALCQGGQDVRGDELLYPAGVAEIAVAAGCCLDDDLAQCLGGFV